eukprot:CAMPEP_0119292270 /NCGR_PEP_ID=MMETSP1329-20130426/43829_1 /TAXON_ID=114041 /ORGANISM="Genus nov. species nov., Strain RCC1024" /LENGTH=340 /DNA_ID=CAMNT_0007293105 /DNA_START=84 /DNA_END=1103 /DNA_ORIENTATION=+
MARGAQALTRASPRGRLSTALEATPLDPAARERIRQAGAERLNAPLQMPARLSPTAATTFLECEQLFLFRNLWRLPEPPSPALVRGSLVHLVLEKMLDLQPEDRTVPIMEEMFREEWKAVRRDYLDAAPPLFGNRDEEREWGLESLRLFRNYVGFEDPTAIDAGATGREEWVEGTVDVPAPLPKLRVVGKLDRLDRESNTVVDYKTGAAARTKAYYSEELTADLEDRALFQLRVYAWMLAQKGKAPDALRLLYLGGAEAAAVDEALPADADARAERLASVERELADVWAAIYAKVEAGDPRAFKCCDRKWCFCHVARPLCFPCADQGDPVADAGDDLDAL